mmetsp:Transcript_5196/g.7317  ORF Transcript_5196/g.7317 Transcript_5196/m.7317 type:complete len:83 (+) Transcript_5196:647-895(+)
MDIHLAVGSDVRPHYLVPFTAKVETSLGLTSFAAHSHVLCQQQSRQMANELQAGAAGLTERHACVHSTEGVRLFPAGLRPTK